MLPRSHQFPCLHRNWPAGRTLCTKYLTSPSLSSSSLLYSLSSSSSSSSKSLLGRRCAPNILHYNCYQRKMWKCFWGKKIWKALIVIKVATELSNILGKKTIAPLPPLRAKRWWRRLGPENSKIIFFLCESQIRKREVILWKEYLETQTILDPGLLKFPCVISSSIAFSILLWWEASDKILFLSIQVLCAKRVMGWHFLGKWLLWSCPLLQLLPRLLFPLFVLTTFHKSSANAIAPRQLPQIASQKIRNVVFSVRYFSHAFLCARIAFQHPENYKFFVFQSSCCFE